MYIVIYIYIYTSTYITIYLSMYPLHSSRFFESHSKLLHRAPSKRPLQSQGPQRLPKKNFIAAPRESHRLQKQLHTSLRKSQCSETSTTSKPVPSAIVTNRKDRAIQ